MYPDFLLHLAVFLAALRVCDAWSPTNGYAPAVVDCPNDINIVRYANGLSPAESDWVSKRDGVTQQALKKFLTRATAKFSDSSLLNSLFSDSTHIPRVAIAASGGGYRSTFGDAGMISAMDDRTYGAEEHGLGGLLQSATYMSALSGGSWFTSTVVFNNWTSVQDLINQMGDDDGSIWDIQQSALTPGGTDTAFTNERFANISKSMNEKKAAGFPVSLADFWGMAFSYYFFPSLPQGGVGYTWSTIQETDAFTNAEMPYLIQLGKAQEPGKSGVTVDSPTIEVTPYDIGSWDPSIRSFADIKYIGTEVSNGSPVTPGKCVEGFDNVNFLIGTCTNLIGAVEQANVAYLNTLIDQLSSLFLGNASTSPDRTLAIFKPNPFKDTTNYDASVAPPFVTDDGLYLVDGGIDGQVIPFTPVMKKEREVDVVFALDHTSDYDENFPTGDSVRITYERQFSEAGKYDAFPYVPDAESFVELGYNKRPMFFGCDASNMTDLAYIPPLVVYMPNVAHSYASNISTFKLGFTAAERLALIKNGFEAATRNNFTDDPDFLGCVGCAVMRRKQETFGLEWPEECQQCFTNYCWDGTTKDDVKKDVDISSSKYSNGTTTTTSTHGLEYSTTLTTLNSDEMSTIHFETSTTVTCHECQNHQPSPTKAYVVATVECKVCKEVERDQDLVATMFPAIETITQGNEYEISPHATPASDQVNHMGNPTQAPSTEMSNGGIGNTGGSGNSIKTIGAISVTVPIVQQVTGSRAQQAGISGYSVVINENVAGRLCLESIISSLVMGISIVFFI